MNKTVIHILEHDTKQGSFLKYQLALSGFRNVHLFHLPAECIYSLEKGNIPHFIIMDLEFSDISAEDFLERVKRISPDIKIIVFSIRDDADYASLLLSSGINDFIVRVGNNKAGIQELIANLQFIIKETNL